MSYYNNPEEGRKIVQAIWDKAPKQPEPTQDEVKTRVEEEVKEVFWNGLEIYSEYPFNFTLA